MPDLHDNSSAGTERPANRLDGSRSPYLRSHSHDPVKWRPWGSGALKRAKRLDRPMLISVGYQSCHWCHVMQRESFLDSDLAGFINRHFVPVKIDRELRPDLDALYMSHLTATTGSGGWPMTVFATPDGVPFYSGTYFPRVSSQVGAQGFGEVLDSVLRAWKLDRERVESTAAEALEYLDASFRTTGTKLDRALLDAAAATIRSQVDPVHGGIGGAPKFPQAPACTFLLEYHRLSAESWPLEVVGDWIRAMLRGGIRDHVAGGIFRYSTDAAWTVPHFEKMLYDQGLLLSTLARLNEVAPDPEFMHAAVEIGAFLERDLLRPDGTFDSSIDAETDGIEGATYLWSREQLAQVLDDSELSLCVDSLLDPGPTGDDEPNVITRRAGRDIDAGRTDLVLEKLRLARDTRPQPARIDNVIVSWNALAARGLIEAGSSFDAPELSAIGLRTLDALLQSAVKSGEALHALEDRSLAKVRLLEDTAALTAACLSAVELSGRRDLLAVARKLHRHARTRFAADDGRLLASAGDPLLPLVPADQADAPVPSGAALFAENAIRLAALTSDERLLEDASQALRQFERAARAVPALAGHALGVAASLLAQSRA